MKQKPKTKVGYSMTRHVITTVKLLRITECIAYQWTDKVYLIHLYYIKSYVMLSNNQNIYLSFHLSSFSSSWLHDFKTSLNRATASQFLFLSGRNGEKKNHKQMIRWKEKQHLQKNFWKRKTRHLWQLVEMMRKNGIFTKLNRRK